MNHYLIETPFVVSFSGGRTSAFSPNCLVKKMTMTSSHASAPTKPQPSF